jgi:hypothetical protein
MMKKDYITFLSLSPCVLYSQGFACFPAYCYRKNGWTSPGNLHKRKVLFFLYAIISMLLLQSLFPSCCSFYPYFHVQSVSTSSREVKRPCAIVALNISSGICCYNIILLISISVLQENRMLYLVMPYHSRTERPHAMSLLHG